MVIIKTINGLKKLIRAWKKKGVKIGFVPTMGALHEGHISLIKKARRESDRVVVSVFVNPTQFGPKEDLKKYPRPFRHDIRLCRLNKVDLVFSPAVNQMYSGFGPVPKTYIDMEKLPDKLCGRSRPGHFRGVMTVVAKLFNLVEPDTAYFGLKDYQQSLIISKMVSDLNINTVIKTLPTFREKDGLAMSSRNKYLTASLRAKAACLYQALGMAKKLIASGEYSSSKIIKEMARFMKKINKARIDYIAIVDRDTLEDLPKVKKGKTLIALAVFLDKTRLIDNTLV
ncbi:MAG: pantoate--beta-alanine ligase [Planctomycetes bacterium]|nr:pantoate--beta-alanine ligase [Planctomycetota bacterium]